MAVHDKDQPRYGAVNASREDHIRRLRKRVQNLRDSELRGVLQGVLDLLEDDSE